MSKPLIFLGCSQMLPDLIEQFERNGFKVHGIIDQDYYGNTADIHGVPFIASESACDFEQLKQQYDFFVGINPVPSVVRNVEKRIKFIDLVDQHQLTCANLIQSTRSQISRTAKFGQGVCVSNFVDIYSDTEFGDHCFIHGATEIAHGAKIGKNVTVQHGCFVGGNTEIGENTYVGVGVRLMKVGGSMRVGKNAVIHPGLIVLRDVEDNEIVSLAEGNTRRIYQQREISNV